MPHNTYYLAGNAHLDPMWQWTWQEGSGEAKATIRSALDRMKEFPAFRFICSSALVFEWIEEFAPAMLEEIRQRVAEGRFILVGGWHVQPDCNMPGGESFARQSLYAQRYFARTFGVTARVGYCVDSFGHCATMPMLLRHSGLDYYIFMRPGAHEMALPEETFRWVAPDGSQVLASRIDGKYDVNFTSAEELQERLDHLRQTTREGMPVRPLFYGVGNHGGGPTIQNLTVLGAYGDAHPGDTLIYSDLLDFFAAAENAPVPPVLFKGELQHHASGCYAAEPRVKTGVRRAETALAAAESYTMLAAALCGKPAKTEAFHKAWDRVCFCHFHDSMGGCSIREAHDETLAMLGAARTTAAEEENNALQTLSWQVDTGAMEQGKPVVVFNPHAFPVTHTVQVNQQAARVTDEAGNPVVSQPVLSSSHECMNRPDTLFTAQVPPLGYRVYHLVQEGDPLPASESPVHAALCDGPCTCETVNGAVLENERLRLTLEAHTGYVLSLFDKTAGRELLADRGGVPVVLDEFYHDTWSHAKNTFGDVMGRFSDARMTVTENGPVRATVKVTSRYGRSVLTQYFSLSAGSDQLQVRARVEWHERHKMLKLAWPVAAQDPQAYYEIPFGVIARPCNGEEEPGLNWTAVLGREGGLAVLNNNTYSSSVQGGTLYHTVLRSPIFGDHGGPRTEESEYTAQGQTDFSYAVQPANNTWHTLVQAGRLLNKGLTPVLETWHTGPLAHAPYAGLAVSAPNVVVSALKAAENGDGLVVRVYETDGRDTDFTVSGDAVGAPLQGRLPAFGVQTYYRKADQTVWQPVLFTEEKPGC